MKYGIDHVEFGNKERFRHEVRKIFCGIMLFLGISSITWAQGGVDIAQLVTRVDPSVVMISLEDKSLGSGFVVDESGIIATNYHVIEGAKNATVTFPANKDQKSYPVNGYLIILPSKDIALIKISAEGMRFPALKLKADPPAKGQRIFAFGSPMGLSGSVSDGMVSALRTGVEVRDIFLKVAQKDIYKESLNYDTDAQWLQITAPISPGNSGGPLVNDQGEVVGINTWVFGGSAGQNLNFSLSITHLKKLLPISNKKVLPLSSLPPARDKSIFGDIANNPDKTLDLWKQFNALKNELVEKMDNCDRQMRKIPPPDRRNPTKGKTARDKKTSALYTLMQAACENYAVQIKALNDVDIDPDLIGYAIGDAEIAQMFADCYEKMSKNLSDESSEEKKLAQAELSRLNEASKKLRLVHDILRLSLSKKYNMRFPTLEETKNPDMKPQAFDAIQKSTPIDFKKSTSKSDKDKSSTSSDKQNVMRIWTDRSGKYQVKAKFVGVEDEKVKLEKDNGNIIFVPIKSLCEADQQFIKTRE